MNGPEHYQAAEKALSRAEDADAGSAVERYDLAAAQVHATLALAAATAMASYNSQSMPAEDADAWDEVAGVPLASDD